MFLPFIVTRLDWVNWHASRPNQDTRLVPSGGSTRPLLYLEFATKASVAGDTTKNVAMLPLFPFSYYDCSNVLFLCLQLLLDAEDDCSIFLYNILINLEKASACSIRALYLIFLSKRSNGDMRPREWMHKLRQFFFKCCTLPKCSFKDVTHLSWRDWLDSLSRWQWFYQTNQTNNFLRLF